MQTAWVCESLRFPMACLLDAVSIAILKFILQIPIDCLELHQPPQYQDKGRVGDMGSSSFRRLATELQAKDYCALLPALTPLLSLSMINTLFLPWVFWIRLKTLTRVWEVFSFLPCPCEVALSSSNHFVYPLHRDLSRLYLILMHGLLCNNIQSVCKSHLKKKNQNQKQPRQSHAFSLHRG